MKNFIFLFGFQFMSFGLIAQNPNMPNVATPIVSERSIVPIKLDPLVKISMPNATNATTKQQKNEAVPIVGEKSDTPNTISDLVPVNVSNSNIKSTNNLSQTGVVTSSSVISTTPQKVVSLKVVEEDER